MSDWDDWEKPKAAAAPASNDDDWGPSTKSTPAPVKNNDDDWGAPKSTTAPKKADDDWGPSSSAAADVNGDADDDGEEIEEVLEVEPTKVGRVIGPKGAVILELQEQFNVKINVEREENGNCKKEVKVTGSKKNVAAAIAEIKMKTGDRPQRSNNNENGYAGNPDDITERLFIDPGRVGRIVGSKGAVISELQSEFEVKINISKEDDDDGKRTVEVIGSQDNVSKAMTKINEKLGSGGGGDGADGDKPREQYIPPEANEDDMYKNAISAGINFDKFDSIEVKITENGGGIAKVDTINQFADAKLRTLLLENIDKTGYKKPTPIQKNAIPIIQSGRDLMACAQTGSGKSAAFILPILDGILKESTTDLKCLIVAPTRELVIQIYEEAKKFANGSWVKVCRAYGGTVTSHQYNAMQNGCHILVATPGRLSDFLNKGYINFDGLKYLVLDEADRMLEMGFKEKIEEIKNHPSFQKEKVQVLMFSATFPQDIQQLAWKFLRNYLFLAVGIVGGASSDVKQEVIEVERNKKRQKLHDTLKEMLKEGENRKILVFVETKKTADFVACFMSEKKISSTSIHGDRLQSERETALNEFRRGIRKVLVATSVASRGLDIQNVTDVINYDLPKSVDDYVHRIGRTGRVGNVGSAISFYDAEKDYEIASHLARILKEAGQPVPEFLGSASGEFGQGDNFGGVDIRGQASGKQQEPDEEW